MSPRHRHERGLRRGYRREVGCDLRARRGGLRGRAGRDRVHVHGGADLAPDRALPPLLGHARRHSAQVHAGRRRRGRDEPVEQVQRAHLRRRSRPARLRARDELAGPRAPRRDARDDREPLRGQGAEQPERRLRPLERRDLLLRPLVRADARLRRGARARAGLPGRLPARAGRRARARRRPRRLRAAERPLLLARRVAPLHQRHAGRVHRRVRRGRLRAALEPPPVLLRASAAASSRRGSPTG